MDEYLSSKLAKYCEVCGKEIIGVVLVATLEHDGWDEYISLCAPPKRCILKAQERLERKWN